MLLCFFSMSILISVDLSYDPTAGFFAVLLIVYIYIKFESDVNYSLINVAFLRWFVQSWIHVCCRHIMHV